MLAVLLLASIAWGTAAEFTHHHGAQSDTRLIQSLATKALETPAEALTTKFDSSDAGGNRSSSRSRVECLICQLHQNLSATLFSEPPGVGPTETHALKATTPVVLQLSEFTANQHGRAPPANL
jgi:hypothetical protein